MGRPRSRPPLDGCRSSSCWICSRTIACALLEVATALAQTLSIDDLLQKVGDTLLSTFRQADRCFVITKDDVSGQLVPRVIKTRRPQADNSPRFSRTIVRNCLDSQQAYLSEDASTDSKFSLSQSITDFRILSVMCCAARRRRKSGRRDPARQPGPVQKVQSG